MNMSNAQRAPLSPSGTRRSPAEPVTVERLAAAMSEAHRSVRPHTHRNLRPLRREMYAFRPMVFHRANRTVNTDSSVSEGTDHDHGPQYSVGHRCDHRAHQGAPPQAATAPAGRTVNRSCYGYRKVHRASRSAGSGAGHRGGRHEYARGGVGRSRRRIVLVVGLLSDVEFIGIRVRSHVGHRRHRPLY